MSKNQLTMEELFSLLQDKISKQEKGSYTVALTKGGVEKISRKIGEEAVEVVIAAFLNNQKRNQKTHDDLVGEICDLFYHSLVLMASQNIEMEEILQELTKRNKRKK